MGVPIISSLTRNTQSWHPGPLLRGRGEQVTAPPVLSTVRPPRTAMSLRTLVTCSNVNYFCIIHKDWVYWLRIVLRQHKPYRLGSKSMCFPGGSVVLKRKKNLPTSAGETRNVSVIPMLGRFSWNRRGKLTPIFLPGKFHGQRILEGCSS